MTTLTPTATALSNRRTTVICFAMLLEGMSSSSINVQIRALQDELALDATVLQLAVGSFLLAYAGLLPLAGQLVDLRNRRTVFLTGVALFGVGCAICGTAVSGWMLVAGRVVQGAGAALSTPAALALITDGLPEGPLRNRAVAKFGAMGAAGFSLGLVVPGFIVSMVGWRWSFLVLLPIVAGVMLVTVGTPVAAPTAPSRRIDFVGVLIITIAMVLAVHLIGAIGNLPAPYLFFELSLVIGAVTWLWARDGVRGYPSAILRSAQVRAACLALATLFAGVLGSMYVLSLALQVREGVDAFQLGMLVLPQPLCFTLTAGLGARLVAKWGPWPNLAIAAVLVSGGLYYLGIVGTAGAAWTATLPVMAAVGCALGLAFPAASIAVVDAVPESQRGSAASLLTMAQNVGGALGTAVLTGMTLVPEPQNDISASPGLLIAAAMVALGFFVAYGVHRAATQWR